MGLESKHSLLKSVQPMQTPEKLLNSYQCLASFVISVLFASLQEILHNQSSISMKESHEWFSSYLNMVRMKPLIYVITVLCIWENQLMVLCDYVLFLQDSSSIVKEKLYSSLSEEDSAKLIVLHCTFLAMQSSQSDQFVRAQQCSIYSIPHILLVVKFSRFGNIFWMWLFISDHLYLTHFASTVTSCCHWQWSVTAGIYLHYIDDHKHEHKE